ncbi:MAG: beta-galactosidase, partial [Clostridia bacterium]|nr:beta-galactosidase [Clostridia bacterium]
MQKQTFLWQHPTMGVCYYPEHWDRSMWKSDLQRMKAAGIEVVRSAEFSWTLIEPREGEFHFELFDDYLNLCAKEGIGVILGTPTATPPAWLTEQYPEVLNALPDGTLLRHGGRRHYTYNSQVYQKLCARIVMEMAKRWGRHPAVVGWQIDNELNCETDEFYAEADHVAFRAFVQKKYKTLDALNDAWGTAFWSEVYTDWSQVRCPRPVLNGGVNPHLRLDYARFVSDSCIRFAKMQADILRQYQKPGDFITTNGLFGHLDNHVLENEVLDVYAYDSYPDFAFEIDRDPLHSRDLNDRKWSRNLIETRSVCPHFGILEQQSGAGGWVNRMEMPAPRPGQLTLWAMQSVAHGADFVSFYRWRTAAFGTELYWHGILDYDGRDNRKLREVTAFSKLLHSLAPVCACACTRRNTARGSVST